jgi:hypothetical protein
MRYLKLAALAAPFLVSVAFAAQEEYQMTGPVLEVTDSKIVLQKENVSREFTRDASTKVTGELKVGGKATVYYKMVAVSIEGKDAGAAGDTKAQADKKPEPKADKPKK